ncbi:MAG: class I SAM-dependent methyltransferase [Inquilinus sp.]|nr:class I SAM-dependent methyltransferase [Inquilinus sp.]
MTIDFGRTAKDYRRHRAGFPDRFFDRLMTEGIVSAGDRLVDLGTGTGTVARGFALRGCAAIGVDPSTALQAEAKRLDQEAGATVRYVTASAEATTLPARSAEVVTAGQCWHWFDGARAAAEARRVMVPGGRLVIGHFDWLPLPGNVVEATERLILKHNPGWAFAGGNGFHPEWALDVDFAGFGDIETFSFDLTVPYRHEDWRGRIRASAGVAASLAPDAVAAFDAEHATLLATDFSDEPLDVPHRVWVLTARAP